MGGSKGLEPEPIKTKLFYEAAKPTEMTEKHPRTKNVKSHMSERHSDNCHDVLETTAPVEWPPQNFPETQQNHDFTTDLEDADDILDEHSYMNTNVKWEKEDSLPREVGYPAKQGRSLLEDTQKIMETPHLSYSEFPRYLKNHLPAKIQWDGTTTGFQEYKVAVEGFYTQMYADYLFDRSFQ